MPLQSQPALARSAHSLARRWSVVPMLLLLASTVIAPASLGAQGVTTSAITGFVTSADSVPVADAIITAVHVPSGTQYRTAARTGGAYNIPNMRVGGPYRVTATMIGFQPETEENVYLSLGQTLRLDFRLERAGGASSRRSR